MGIVSGLPGKVGVSIGTEVVSIGTVAVSTVDGGGGTQYVHTVEVLVTKTVETVEVVSREVILPLVMVLVTGHVVKVATMLRQVSHADIESQSVRTLQL